MNAYEAPRPVLCTDTIDGHLTERSPPDRLRDHAADKV